MDSDRPYADPIEPAWGHLWRVARGASFGLGILGLQVALLLAALAVGGGVSDLAGSAVLQGVSLVQGGVFLAGAWLLSGLGREESEQVPRAMRQLFASGVCFFAAGVLLLVGLRFGFGTGELSLLGVGALLFGLETAVVGLLQVRALHPGRPDDLCARLAARTSGSSLEEQASRTPPLRFGRVTADKAGLQTDVAVGDRAGTLRVDLSRLPWVAELRVPLASLPSALCVVHADVAGADAEPLGDAILDGLVAVKGPPSARAALQQDHGALLAFVRAWPGSSIEQGALVLRVAQPEAVRVGLLGRLRGQRPSNLFDVEVLLATLQSASPALLALAEVLDPGPSAGGQSTPAAPPVRAAPLVPETRG